ncbi:Protein CBG21101 [Caenorhabditis briggsae]|uniref:Protein CBG21101 n=1 Tax=Caenorhabditis briggsae TaxID=6238 RepID=A8XZH2_CAEBR|nr:Protein CBG21101 [Caenorhabditis briggsae]CAP38099.2 Protein CBG21101 [Caenorhabditis briggsae]
MSDDLSAFFAKKKDKKKKTAVKIEEVGQALERRAKRQEEYEHEPEEQVEKRGQEEEKAQSQTEESEWIEYGESQGRLEGLRIKDMGLESEQDQVNVEEHEDREAHETKTWGQVSSEKKASEETEQAVTISDKAMAAAYKPPALRKTTGGVYRPRGPAANFDMSSDAAFPSLADASKIEKVKKEEGKGAGGWVKAGSGMSSNTGPSSSGPPRAYTTISGSGRESALAAAKPKNPAKAFKNFQSMLSSTGPAPTRSEPAATPSAAPASNLGAPKSGSYVPPHLRKTQA